MLVVLKDDKFLLSYKRLWNKNDFLVAAGVVEGSYSAEVAERIYDCLFNSLTDLRAEHERYYSKEYRSFGSFLYWKYDMDERLVRDCSKRIDEGYAVGYGEAFWGGDYIMGGALTRPSGEWLPYVKKVLAVLERVTNESQD